MAVKKFEKLSQDLETIPEKENAQKYFRQMQLFLDKTEVALTDCRKTQLKGGFCKKIFSDFNTRSIEKRETDINNLADGVLSKITASIDAISKTANQDALNKICSYTKKNDSDLNEMWNKKVNFAVEKYSDDHPMVEILEEGVKDNISQIGDGFENYRDAPPDSDKDVKDILSLISRGTKELQKIEKVPKSVREFINRTGTGSALVKDILENSEIKDYFSSNPKLLERLKVNMD